METKCGFSGPGAVQGLILQGPTLIVDIGFDPNYEVGGIPAAAMKGIHALVDTGATASCIDALLATDLGLPIVDRRYIAGVGGKHEVNMHMAQVFVPGLNHVQYGAFAAVNLAAGGQHHRALIGRDFLRQFTMIYEGHTGTVIIKHS